MITPTSDDTNEATVSGPLTFTAANWNVPQTVTVTHVDESVADGDLAYNISLPVTSTDTVYAAEAPKDTGGTALPATGVAGTNTDNDVASITVTPTSGLSVDESGTTDTFDVVLGSAPAVGETVEIPVTSLDPASGTTDVTSLIFDDTNWNVPQTVTVTGVDDSDVDMDQTFMIELGTVITGDASYTGFDPDDVEVTNVDDDVAGDAGAVLSSLEQSRSAMGMLAAAHDHVNYRLRTSGQAQDEIINSVTLNRGEASASGSVGQTWYNVGLTRTTLSGAAAGEGEFAYVLTGFDMRSSERSVLGVLVGGETGDWNFVSESDVDKTGVSLGLYQGQRIGTNLAVSSYLTYTRFKNAMTGVSGATAEASSDRLIGSIQVSGSNTTEGGFNFRPYVSAQYAVEEIGAYTYSDGLALDASSASVGEYSAGMEITTPFNKQYGQFYVKGALADTFGTGEVTLSDGTTLSFETQSYGTLSAGWISNGGTDSVGRVDVTVNGIGDENREEVTVSGHFERRR